MVTGFVLFVSVAWYLSTYNRFVKYRNRIEEAWSSIDVALKRRFNLIPNLQKAVAAYGSHEAQVFKETDSVAAVSKEAVSKEGVSKEGVSREGVSKEGVSKEAATDAPQRAESESRISHGLDGLLALAEDYPDLKASQNFLSLQARLSEVETDIQTARQKFNGAVRRYNTLIDSIPSNLIARKFNFTKVAYFSLELATQREVPDIDLGRK
jgi:LemA protein